MNENFHVIWSFCYAFFSIRLGVFLRRYPIARLMVIVYMVSRLLQFYHYTGFFIS